MKGYPIVGSACDGRTQWDRYPVDFRAAKMDGESDHFGSGAVCQRHCMFRERHGENYRHH